ncbi:sugar-binding protein [Stomatohabitans albus]|uniref:sugar-binding protein n=1 Tax=Stomatohabitans albus TaxID=3110766 RepID=UPI00300C2004
MKNLRKTGLLALLATLVMVLAACSGGGRSGDSGSSSGADVSEGASTAAGGGEVGKIGVSLPQKTSENWVRAEQYFNEAIKEMGLEGTVLFANGGVTEQQNQLDTLISGGAKVIVVGAIDGSQLGGQLKSAHDQGIKVIAYDRMLTNTDAVDYYVAFDAFKVGELQGKSLLEGLEAKKPGGPWTVEIFAGSPDDANSLQFFNGAMSVLDPEIEAGKIEVKSGQRTFEQAATQGWKGENAQKRMDTLLSGFYSGSQPDGVLSPNDNLAQYILQSFTSAGKTGPVITGQDSEENAVKRLMDGSQYSSIYKDTRLLVNEAVKMAKEIQEKGTLDVNDPEGIDNGTKMVPTQALEPIITTKDNAAEVYKDDPVLAPLTQ